MSAKKGTVDITRMVILWYHFPFGVNVDAQALCPMKPSEKRYHPCEHVNGSHVFNFDYLWGWGWPGFLAELMLAVPFFTNTG